MDQNRLDELEDRVDNFEQGNGWHEWGKHVLKELERLNKGQETMRNDNNSAHRTIHKKLDVQRSDDEKRLISCNERFLTARVFHWLLLVLIVVIGGLTTLSITNKIEINSHAVAQEIIEKVVESAPEVLDNLKKVH